MITKFERIKNVAVFRDFKWDDEVLKPDGSVANFSHINILYGRNYSGKTTLSRLLRAVQTGILSDKYNNPEFNIQLPPGNEINQDNYQSSRELVRVFNEDFVKENLKFITNPDEGIEPFALIGDDNVTIENEIEALRSEIGVDIEGSETGLKAQLTIAEIENATANTAHQGALVALDNQLRDKAIGRGNGIKYKSDRFGDQNYTKPKLEADILTVLAEEYVSLTDDEIKEYEKLIEEKAKISISPLSITSLTFGDLSSETKLLVTKKVGVADKIEELAKDAVLNRWVSQGKELHKGREGCAFCGNTITDARWYQLDKHFDKESDSLEKEIDALLLKIKEEKKAVADGLDISKDLFYAKFHDRLDVLSADYERDSTLYLNALEELTAQLQSRKADIINTKEYDDQVDHSEKLEAVWESYKTLQTGSNDFTGLLKKEQADAKDSLRLHEVNIFASTINYIEQIKNIEEYAVELQTKKDAKNIITSSIQEKLDLIEAKKREMNDEEKGAIKVNEYLTHFFGHKFLSLEAKENEDDVLENKSIRFEVIRDREKAFHLSEGECSLLAYCYFLAKLEDVETAGTKPIIWIDDPISSLDSNHIFFAFSLLASEIVATGKFEQLFVSTHNLDFLKYLKRLKGKYLDSQNVERGYQISYFVINRAHRKSTITVMPKYLKEYVTEFNYLFHQVHKCANIDVIDDTNYTIYYNFANNARKFLEIYLYYKYPDGASAHGKLERFFGEGTIPAILTERINNEYSHMCGLFERGETPVEVPEMKSVALLILEKLQQDSEQYNSLLISIGEPVQEAIEEPVVAIST